MLSLDPKAPPDVVSIQKWFAGIITRPIDADSQMMPISPSGRLMSEESAEFIRPNRTLSSDQRIQIYNQQYWWRLLSILHQNFPLLTRLFGYYDFNLSIGIPFLSCYPPRHWSLSKLGDQLASWIEQHYTAADKLLVLSAAELDWAYQELFFAPPAISVDPCLDLLSKKMGLQRHVRLFKLPFNLFSYRRAFLAEKVEFWLEADFPFLPKEKTYFFLLYRTEQNFLLYKELEEGEWTLLDRIAGGCTIEEACNHLEKSGGILYDQAQASLAQWVQEWIKEKWLLARENET